MNRTIRILFGIAAATLAVLAGSYFMPDLPLPSIDVGEIQRFAFRLIGAAAIFGVILYLARLVQNLLRRNVLTAERIDQGIAYAIEKAIGYAGLVLAIIYAASAVGLDLSGLTIVAGALSVGIGFGLQTVISNFVCGLIVLIERPIRIGDWVVVKDFEGTVRRINVRSTEIETFDGASVLIPNSEFITGTVQNWMLGSPGGRVSIKVRTAQDADPEQVLELLRATAARHAGVLATPAPDASFDGFGGDGLDFTLGVQLANIAKGAGVRSDLRCMVVKALREAGIALAVPQRDVRLVGGGLERPAETRPAS